LPVNLCKNNLLVKSRVKRNSFINPHSSGLFLYAKAKKMHIAVKAGEEQKREFLSKGVPQAVIVQWLGPDDLLEQVEVDAYFDLLFKNEFTTATGFIKQKIVFINAVSYTSRDIGHANYIRINAWNGFLTRSIVEAAGGGRESRKQAEGILQVLGWKFIWAPDEPGMISARILSMVVNEAYFALGEGISSRDEIDTAMRLGTNYPYGPFEWGQKIGIGEIYILLNKLQQQSANRYAVAPLLEQDARNNGIIA
jgi:3-hydroxybutyryl-CoA dehydrogenase